MQQLERCDSTNDGLMNAYTWRIDLTQSGILNHPQLITSLENVVRDNAKTTFIACHLANCEYDLEILGALFRKYSNLYADFGARFGETAPIPRYMNSFCEKYQDRLVYGTDMENYFLYLAWFMPFNASNTICLWCFIITFKLILKIKSV